MQAIQTKWYPPTNDKNSYIHAKCEAGSIKLSPNTRHGIEFEHRLVAEALAKKLGWVGESYGELVQGSVPCNPEGYVFVFVNRLTRKKEDHD